MRTLLRVAISTALYNFHLIQIITHNIISQTVSNIVPVNAYILLFSALLIRALTIYNLTFYLPLSSSAIIPSTPLIFFLTYQSHFSSHFAPERPSSSCVSFPPPSHASLLQSSSALLSPPYSSPTFQSNSRPFSLYSSLPPFSLIPLCLPSPFSFPVHAPSSFSALTCEQHNK